MTNIGGDGAVAEKRVANDNQCWTPNKSIAEFGRFLDGPLQMSWVVSRKCNFKCPHCFNNSPTYTEYEPPRDIIIERIIEALPFNVCLCGGEPFVFDDLDDLCRRLRGGGIPIVSLATNGFLATRDRLKQVADAGLNSIQISLDGFCEEDHARLRPFPGSWKRATQAIQDAVDLDVFKWVAVSYIPNAYSVAHFPELVKMLYDMGVGHVRVQPLMSSGRAHDAFDDLTPSSLQYAQLVRDIVRLRAEYLYCGINIEWGDPLEHIWVYTKTPTIPQQLGIQSNGWYELSPYLPVLCGDATRHSVKEFWQRSQKEMWNFPLVLKLSRQLTIIDGMRQLHPNIYYEAPVKIDVFDEENWRLAQETDDPDVLIEFARSKGYYDNDQNKRKEACA